MSELINISHTGFAIQSSPSTRWGSNPYDQRIIHDAVQIHDYAFHTEKEAEPWLIVLLPLEVTIKKLYIKNRIKNCKERALALNTQYFSFERNCYMPLPRPTIDREQDLLFQHLDVCTRILRFMLPGVNQLHLARLDIYVSRTDQTSMPPFSPDFYSRRTDGFGQRLLSILGAIKLAKEFNSKYFFDWLCNDSRRNNSTHIWDDSYNTFSKKYLDEHYLNSEHMLELDARAGLLRDVRKNAILIEHKKNSAQLFKHLSRSGPHAFSQEFEEIGFIESLALAREAGRAVNLRGITAIHIRGGDIITGEYRHYCKYQYKVIPAPLLMGFLESKDRTEKYCLVFQDKSLETFFRILYKNDSNISFASDYASAFFDKKQLAMFEIALMSECKQIIAKDSAFAVLSSTISQKGLIDFDSVSHGSVESILRFVANHRSFVCHDTGYKYKYISFLLGYVFMVNPESVESAEFCGLIALAREHDAENKLSLLLEILCFVKNINTLEVLDTPEAEQMFRLYRDGSYPIKPLKHRIKKLLNTEGECLISRRLMKRLGI